MPGKCKFNDLWLCSDDIKKWLSPVNNDVFKAYCKICKTKFDVSHSGISAIKSHAKGTKHNSLIDSLIQGTQTTLCFKGSKNQDEEVNEQNTEGSAAAVKEMHNNLQQPTDVMTKYLLNEQVIKAEILWALHTMLSHISNRSGGDASSLFKIMFPDSIIAEKFRMHKDKLAYVVTYGLGPYFQDLLVNDLRKCDYFSLSFDESLNKVAQKGQMDIIVRFWNNSKNCVDTRYLSSMFLEHSKAADLLDAFTTCLNDLGLSFAKVQQVETDGPNVNLKFLKDFEKHLKTEHNSTLLDIGTCSLHIIHGCYKTALTKSNWNINDFLRASYYLFKDFPTRRADYKHFSGSTLMPLKLCAIRWVENSNVIERAIKILPFLKMYVEGVKAHPPATKNFDIVSGFITDDLLLAKLCFLQSVAAELETFLIFFQSDKPLLPHLYEELAVLFKSLASRFLKKDMLLSKNLHDILLVDINNKENYLPIKKIEVGFGAASACSGVSEYEKITFYKECRTFLINILSKLKIKSPLCKKLVKGLSCFSPKIMLNESIRSNRINIALEKFVDRKHLTPIQADCAKSTYQKLCEDPIVSEGLKSYNMKKDRLDELLMDLLKTVNDVNNPLLTFTKKVLTLFHGNAAVERSFSINKKCIVENLHEKSLIAQRLVHSAILNFGCVEKIPITKAMITAVRGASSKRNEALQQLRMKQNSDEQDKKVAEAELRAMKKRKLEIMQQANEEIKQLESKIVLTENKLKKNV